MLSCVTQPRLSTLWILGPMVTSARAGSARSSLGMGFLRVVPGLPAVVSRCRCSSSLACVRAASSGSGRALPLARYASPGGSPAERAVRPLLVVDVLEFGELFVELVDRGRRGTGGEPLLQGAVVAFDLALRLGGGWQGRPLLWRTPISASVRSERPGVALIGLVVYTVPLSVSVLAGMPCSAHA